MHAPRLLCLATLLVTLAHARAQQPAPPPSAPPSSTQIIDLFASIEKTGAPETSLTASDLEVVDDGKPTPPAGSLAPGQPGLRPVVLWLVVQCVTKGDINDGSGFLRGFTTDLASGLTKLQPGEAYGVAHWCDDGASALDLPPNRHITQVGPAIAQILAPTIVAPTNPFLGESALLKVIQDANRATAAYNPNALPVLLFFYGDFSSANARDVAALAAELLRGPALVYLVNNGLARSPVPAFQELRSVVGHLAIDTGGSFFHVPFGDHDSFVYAQAVATVLARLHTRYQLTWTPRFTDGQEHTLSVRLTPAARKAHPGLLLRSRAYYVGSPASPNP